MLKRFTTKSLGSFTRQLSNRLFRLRTVEVFEPTCFNRALMLVKALWVPSRTSTRSVWYF